jgi:hypothetical protein
MAGEVRAQCLALLVANVGEDGILDDVVGGGDIVQAL